MERFTFRCTACRQALRAAADWVGRKVKCPRCESIQLVPAVAKPLAAAPNGRSVAANKALLDRNRPGAKKDSGYRPESESGSEPSTPRPRTTRRPPVEPKRPIPVPKRKSITPREDVAELDKDETDEEIPRKKRRRAKRRNRGTAADWQKVRLGASLLCYEVWVLIALPVFAVAWALVLFLSPRSLFVSFFGVGLATIGLCLLAVLALELVGSCLFLFAPARYGARRLAQVYVVSEAVLLVPVPAIWLVLRGAGSTTLIILLVVWGIPEIIVRFSKPFLFQALARNVRADELAESWVEYMKLTFGATAFSAVLDAGAIFLAKVTPGAGFVVYPATCILGLIGICTAVWYCRSLFRLRNAIREYVDNR